MYEFWGDIVKKQELLVPAGNMECLRQAVFNGCDAVYLACKNFGARKFAMNFSNEEVEEAIHFCHLYGVRIYVTMNTLVKNEEVDAFLEQASFLHQKGVDALIVQDFGMICLLREMFPNLEIHASTQANISSREICQLYYDLGVKRVVFSRELSIEEIDSIDVPIEKEVFIHGALCISYSGCCLMSSMLGGRSGNRGECAGVCRMPFSLVKDGEMLRKDEYLLSTKELNTSHHMTRLLDSSIDSFKVEGRMKGPLYVGFITRFYRKLIDGEPFSFEDENQLKTIFNREFTEGRLFDAKDENFMNPKSPNHIGLEIGNVTSVTKDKIKIQLQPSCSLHQGDAIRFMNSQEGFIVNYLYDEKGNYITSSNDICYVDNKIHLKKIDKVSKTQDFLLEKEFNKSSPRKIPISFSIKASVGKPLTVSIQDGIYHFTEEGDPVLEAMNAPLSEESIKKQFQKLGGTPFSCNSIEISMDNHCFLPIHSLNEIRRSLVSKLIAARMNPSVKFIKKEVLFEKENHSRTDAFERIHCSVFNKEQLEACLENKIDAIYVRDRNLYLEYQNQKNIYYMMPRCLFNISSSLEDRILVSDYAFYPKQSMIGNYSLNVMNIYTAYYLHKIGINSVCLSAELTEEECHSFVNLYTQKFGECSFIVLAYGRVENMIIRGNILNLKESNNTYQLMDSRKRYFPLYYDGRLTHILHSEKRNYFANSFDRRFILRYDFYEETKDEVISILKNLKF